jgi:hypothetical protein
LREHFEHGGGNAGFGSPPIGITTWIDRDGYQWIGFDDPGTGMDEPIVRNHLLKVGSSYYQSAQFRADMLQASPPGGTLFQPISRFGIGLLSCFLACDRVEISTLRLHPDRTTGAPLRLSLDGLQGFFTLQTPDLPAKPMPAGDGHGGAKEGYKRNPGTSIACRLERGGSSRNSTRRRSSNDTSWLPRSRWSSTRSDCRVTCAD